MISSKTVKKSKKDTIPNTIPILTLRNNVLFPGIIIPVSAQRQLSIDVINAAVASDHIVGVVSQINGDIETPGFKDVHWCGTVARISQMMTDPDGVITIILEGIKRFNIVDFTNNHSYMEANVRYTTERFPKPSEEGDYVLTIAAIRKLARRIIESTPHIPAEIIQHLDQNKDVPEYIVNYLAGGMDIQNDLKQEMLEEKEVFLRAKMLFGHMEIESQMIHLKGNLTEKTREEMDKQQREYFLNQQIKTIQNELGDNPQENDISGFKARAATKLWNEKVAKVFKKELDRFQRMNPQSAEYGVQMNYLDTLLELPWGVFTADQLDLKHAAEVLERDHFGLEKVKERILEYLAVLKLKQDMKSPILCFYGPPGVGKTSLGKSIAEAIGRKYVRMSLGGLHDESEIRGHRKTYIGAMPGRIIQHLKKTESANPVFILDEIDKLGRSNHGDPSSALLEVLDPEQNTSFYDNYIETEFDLSRVMFIATANNLSDIPAPLRDRMEIIEVSGYTQEEKVEIAKRHLLPKQLEAHGVMANQINLGDAQIERLIDEHTSESGVRGLDKSIAKVIRNRAKQIAMEEKYEVDFTSEDLDRVMGPGRIRSKYSNNDVAGVVTGLAWTSVGGEILFIESSLTTGKGKLTLTGSLGDVMKESAIIALEFLKSHSKWIDLDQKVFDEFNVHIHVPEGATPKDGPSAGIAMLTSLASLFTQRKVKSNLAMTGEITLRGEVLPVGGLKEKVLAAKRAAITEIIVSESNRKDIEEISAHYLTGLTFHFVKTMREVLDKALTNDKVENPIDVAISMQVVNGQRAIS